MKLATCLYLVSRLRISGAEPLTPIQGVDRATSLSSKIRESNGIVLPVPMAARSKAWFYSHSLVGIVGSNPTGGMDVCLL